MTARATRVVTFGCLDRCPIGAREKSEDWPIPGATGKTMDQLRAIRDELRRRVAEFSTRLEASTVSAKPSLAKFETPLVCAAVVRPLILTHCGAGSDRSAQDAAEHGGACGLVILRCGCIALGAF